MLVSRLNGGENDERIRFIVGDLELNFGVAIAEAVKRNKRVERGDNNYLDILEGLWRSSNRTA